MSDLISRQAAIDATTETVFVEYEENADKEESIIRQTKAAIRDRIKALPSVQPDVPDINVGDMISRQAAIEALRTCYDTEAITYTNGNEYIDYDQALDLINTLPPVQPNHNAEVSKMEIIHCKDCKFARMTVDGECKYCDIWFPDEKTYMPGDYYCASAEWKGEAE